MDFAFDEDQRAIQELVRDVLARQVPLGALADAADGNPVDRVAWDVLGREVGALGLVLPEEAGGQGYGLVELVLLLQECGRAGLPAPMRDSLVALRAVAAGDPALAEKLLADGAMVTLALDGSGLTYADGTVAGTVGAVPFAPDADMLVVPGDGAWLVVDLGGVGVDRRPGEGLDPTRRTGALSLDGVAAQRLDAPAGARVAGEYMLGLAAEIVGLADRCLELTVEHVTTRRQFGSPIGSFQAVKHSAADLLIEIELARTAIYLAACRVDQQDGDGALDREARRAFVQAARTAVAVGTATIQLHGGIGFTWEHPAHVLVKRLRASAHAFGGVAVQSGLLAEQRLAD